jgi:hypothetical protein
MTDVVRSLPGEQEPEAPSRRRLWRWVGGAVLLVALLGADVAWRNIEVDRLLNSLEATEPPVKGFETDVGTAFERYRNVAARTPDQEAALLREVRQVGSARATELAGVRESAAEVVVLPWHRSAQNAKRAALTYIDAYVARFRDVSTDPRAIYPHHFIDRSLGGTSRIAEKTLRDAVPTVEFGWFRFRTRIDEALAP